MERNTIGRVARQAGVGVETIRYYERRGLLERPRRTHGRYREYGAETVRRLEFIRRARAQQFTLKEIQQMLDCLSDEGEFCASAKELIRAKIEEIDERIRSMSELRELLVERSKRCPETKGKPQCKTWRELNSDAKEEER
jgi:MerR family copper efflux transcriptional regulator